MANSLASETSPYLLQHAHNPVDWMPWGEAAFARALEEDKLIFLSIGYSTCHWCHVMERESFEHQAIADLLNERFISIKVDREERPDIDATYMAFVVATTGHGGWPMSVFLTPDLKPIYGGTYYPPEDRVGRIGFPTLLQRLHEVWTNERDKVLNGAERAVQAIQASHEKPTHADEMPSEDVFDTALEQLKRMFDPEHGGFGRAPKFPRASLFSLLARLVVKWGENSAKGHECLKMLEVSLQAISQGGIYDHLGGGFHRYSVDSRWHVPHYEKMLYDQAQLIIAYTELWQLTQEWPWKAVVHESIDYVLRDLRDAGGGFHSAEDADSLESEEAEEKHEGAFYTWAEQEIEALLRPELAIYAKRRWGTAPEGNAQPDSDPLGELKDRNTLYLAETLGNLASELEITVEQAVAWEAEVKDALFSARSFRPRPHLDDKVIVGWNGLMISALSRAGAILSEPAWLTAAEEALDFIQRHLWNPIAGTLIRSWRKGPGKAPGFADDSVALIQACLDTYEATGTLRWLQWAVELQKALDEHFWNAELSGYQLSPHGLPHQLIALREHHDGAEPAPNSIACLNLLRLAQLLDSRPYREKAEQLLKAAHEWLTERPFSVPAMATALDFALSVPRQIAITSGEGREDMIRAAWASPRPRVILHLDGNEGQLWLGQFVPSLALMLPKSGRSTAYVCEHFTCQAPVTSAKELGQILGE